ncbi:MAG: hypothetical protein OXF86_11975 [Caldilineaceae bacterium]|nr:hypothetical protein [Caldilineaceae bacterium]
MGEKRIGQSQPGKEETGALTTKPGCGDREEDEWMNFNRWWTEYVIAADGGDLLPSDIVDAITEAEPWLNAGLQECSARAIALLIESYRADGSTTLATLLHENTGEDLGEALQVLWGYRFLLEADKVSDINWQRFKDAEPDFQEMLLAGFEIFHLIWREVGRKASLKHPVAALIEGYLSRVEPDTRDTGIMPAPLAAHRHIETTADTGFLFDVTEYDRAPQTGEILTNDKPAHLPSLTPRPSGVVPALPIVLWDRAVEAKPGRGAPYGLRLWVEAILSVPVSERSGKRTISIPFGQMVKSLFNRYRRDQFPALSAAFRTVHNMGIAWGETGAESVWVPVVVRNRPERWDAYDSHVVFEVQLPPGSGSGPLVYKPYLREIGRHSAPGYRAALGLCYLWDRYGANNGRFIQATVPRLTRNDDGDLLGADGSVLLTKQGQPVHQYMVGKGKDRQLRPDVVALDDQDNRVENVSQAARDPNPAANRYPVLTDADFVTLCYPAIDETSRGSRQLSKSARSHRQRRAREVIENMADKGYCTMEAVAGGLRIMPPDGWGAGFNG